ncbi:P-loop containing nucleoside triphosphate hydrolase protein [Lasiosphaeris hirsuta]|uniref:P-loop containing nucleoside triphosphate hydrolase protein n=1 Tax=Lasiosphaeris hirsuta TaxID=260670 RepID=A0AA40DXK8_9PEZI|nr:P-loop containing nucleoside triphosphate hydrolase protein [Lasiosphaeris hirsuta]
MRAEGLDGDPDVYTSILAKRIARGRGTESYRNMKEIDDVLTAACDRQADRLQRERRLWTDDDGPLGPLYLLTKEDLLGLPPADIRQSSSAYQKLQSMAGLEKIKRSVEELMDLAKRNYYIEIKGKKPIHFNHNRVFLGPPGSGKTTVANLFGQIVVDIGLVSQREVVVKNPSDFISVWLGGSEENTRKILDETKGKVLIIDDAHGLCLRSVPGQDLTNTDRGLAGIHDTIVSKTSSEPGQDRCIILVGYAGKMHELLERANPGLRSRFPLEDAFEFRDYEVSELMAILKGKLATDDIAATEKAKHVALRVLARARDRPGFGNGRDVHNLVNRARAAHKDRQLPVKTTGAGGLGVPAGVDLDESGPVVLEPVDFDPHWEREWGTADCRELFQDFVGFENIIEQFQGYQEVVAGMRLHGKDPHQSTPFTFVFKGPPGTGKTSTARKVGQIFFDMGFLASDEVIECSASDLIGQYVGHTAPLVQGFLEKALGKVLFIDEAYRLSPGARGVRSGSSFEEEAIGELVDGLTKQKYAHKIVVILAGYSDDMDLLMKSNRGLRGRFATEVIFPELSPKQSLKYLGQLIGKMGIIIADKQVPGEKEKEKVYRLIRKLGATRDWSNGRDIETLANTVIGKVFRREGKQGKKSDRLTVSTDELVSYLKDMLRARLAGELVDRE